MVESKDSIPTVKLAAGGQLQGAATILRYLARLSDEVSGSLYGASVLEAIQVDYFLDMSATGLLQKETLLEYCAELNTHLAERSYLVGSHLTVADFAVWGAVQANQRWKSVYQRQAKDYPHLMRWFNFCNKSPEFTEAAKVQSAAKEAALAKSKAGGSFEIDLVGAAEGKVCTRFPPEPSGYLHIGHAKAALLNDYFAKRYMGRLILRFDDTNPTKEKEEFVDNIISDLRLLGIKHDVLTHTSDYFERILELGEYMLREGKAYIDDTPVELMRQERGEGIDSKRRNNSVEENLRLWAAMREGNEEGLKCVMRAKINMQHDNKTLRDPTLFRCSLVPHHRTGSKYKVYPTYDFACPIVDSVEGVTHTLRTSEYRDRDEQYYWLIDALKLRKPHIWDYSRLNFVHTVLSKRRLQWFVDQGLVEGWHDPRFPTIQGVTRRGMQVQALREFILSQGASKATNLMQWDKIWAINKQHIDPIAPRWTALSLERPVVMRLLNVPAALEVKAVDLHPKNPAVGKKSLVKSNTLLIEQDDAKLIKQDEEITLMGWGNAIVRKIVTDADGVVSMEAELNPTGNVSATSKKITWLALKETSPYIGYKEESKGELPVDEDVVSIRVVEFDHLISVPKLTDDMNFEDYVNPVSRYETRFVGEGGLRNLNKGDVVQLQRRGFFVCDSVYRGPQKPLVLFAIPDGRQGGMSVLTSKLSRVLSERAAADKARAEAEELARKEAKAAKQASKNKSKPKSK